MFARCNSIVRKKLFIQKEIIYVRWFGELVAVVDKWHVIMNAIELCIKLIVQKKKLASFKITINSIGDCR